MLSHKILMEQELSCFSMHFIIGLEEKRLGTASLGYESQSVGFNIQWLQENSPETKVVRVGAKVNYDDSFCTP